MGCLPPLLKQLTPPCKTQSFESLNPRWKSYTEKTYHYSFFIVVKGDYHHALAAKPTSHPLPPSPRSSSISCNSFWALVSSLPQPLLKNELVLSFLSWCDVPEDVCSLIDCLNVCYQQQQHQHSMKEMRNRCPVPSIEIAVHRYIHREIDSMSFKAQVLRHVCVRYIQNNSF